MKDSITIGTRGSKLALWQANHVADLLREACPGVTVTIEVIKTTGDKITDVALSKIGDKGLFTKELEKALSVGRVDMCVHSMKDVPTVLPSSLVIAACPKRADVRDALVAGRPGMTLEQLPAGSKVGTGSLRRLAQLRALRSDLDYIDLRGNLDTRLGKVRDGELDAAVLAAAGITRMGWSSQISSYIDPSVMIPAVGQGAIGVEICVDDLDAMDACQLINDPDTMRDVEAERTVMRVLEGGCQVPIGAHARVDDGVFALDAMVARLDGSDMLRASAAGEPKDAQAIAELVVGDLLSQGARKVLDEVRAQADVMLPGTKSGQEWGD